MESGNTDPHGYGRSEETRVIANLLERKSPVFRGKTEGYASRTLMDEILLDELKCNRKCRDVCGGDAGTGKSGTLLLFTIEGKR